MKKKDLVDIDAIIEKMKKDFPEGLSEMEMARYMYIELGKRLSFNINYVSDSDKKSEDVYWEPVNFKKIECDKYICRQIAEIYAESLKRLGINAKRHYRIFGEIIDKYFDATFRHAYTVIKLKDGRKFIADLVYDMPFVQGGMDTLYFGTVTENRDDIELIDQKEVEEIDKKIGYSYPIDLNKTTYVYTNEFYRMVRKEMENPELLKPYVDATYPENEREETLIRYKLDAVSRYFNVSQMGYREGRMFLERILKEFLSEDEQKKITFSNLFTENACDRFFGETKMAKCFTYTRDDGKNEYYLYVPGKNLERMSKEKVRDFIKNDSYKIDEGKGKIPGLEDR